MTTKSSNPGGKGADLLDRVEKLTAAVESLSQPRDSETRTAVTKAFNATGKAGNGETHIGYVTDNVDPRGGFKSLDHFAKDCVEAARPGGQIRKALFEWHQKAASGLNETAGAEGGFLVPPEFSNEIMQRVYDNDLLSRCRSFTATGNSLVIPAIDETSRVDGSQFGGAAAYWDAEAAQFTSSKPRFARVTLVLKKLLALTYVTEELLQDSGTPLQQYLTNIYAQVIAWKIGNAIVRGTGAGMPQGILNAPCLVTVSKETGQAATTIVYENIVKMWARMWAPSRANAVWLVNQDIEPQLMQLALNIGTAGTAAYLPPGGLSEKPYGTLMGRPVIPVEFCSTLGTVGDILLVDLSQYLVLRKGESQTESSIHLRFDFAETAFRVIYRQDGSFWWTSALTPSQGTNTLSPAIALATRS